MAFSSAKRALIAVAALVLAAAVGVRILFHHARRADQQHTDNREPAVYSASPQQAERAFALLAELPGNAPVVGYVDVEALVKLQGSPLSKLLGLRRRSPASQDTDYQRFVRETGFDYTRDLDRTAIAFWPASPGAMSKGSASDNRAFAVADGRFDKKRIAAYALKSGKSLANGARTIYVVPGSPPVAFEFLAPTRIALTSGTKSQELLSDSQVKMDRSFRAQVDRVAGAPLFAVARTEGLPNSFYANFNNSPQIESLARSVKGFTLAVHPQGNIIKVALESETVSAQNALALTTLLEISRMGALMALANPKPNAQMTKEQTTFLDALLRQLKVSHEDRSVRLYLDITPSLLGDVQSGSRDAPTNLRP
jgi:hypothetical protein